MRSRFCSLVLAMSLSAAAQPVQAADYSSRDLPILQRLSVSVDVVDGKVTALVAATVRTKTNGLTQLQLTFLNQNKRTAFDPPCQEVISLGSTDQIGISRPLNSAEALRTELVGDWKQVEYAIRNVLSDGANPTNVPICRGTYGLYKLSLTDAAKHTLFGSNERLHENPYPGVDWSAWSNVWDADPTAVSCPRVPYSNRSTVITFCNAPSDLSQQSIVLTDQLFSEEKAAKEKAAADKVATAAEKTASDKVANEQLVEAGTRLLGALEEAKAKYGAAAAGLEKYRASIAQYMLLGASPTVKAALAAAQAALEHDIKVLELQSSKPAPVVAAGSCGKVQLNKTKTAGGIKLKCLLNKQTRKYVWTRVQ